uniref:Lipocalin n=1 Tax=Amblyomma maculatum TaxID=34609 RepID=G3MTD9_AMBMU
MRIRSPDRSCSKQWFCVNFLQYKKNEGDLLYLDLRYKLVKEDNDKLSDLPWRHKYFTATLQNGKELDDDARMAVSSLIDIKPDSLYTLEYWNQKAKCFVLSFIGSNGRKKCEMYEWNETVHIRANLKPPGNIYRNCEQEFHAQCGASFEIIYRYLGCSNATYIQG